MLLVRLGILVGLQLQFLDLPDHLSVRLGRLQLWLLTTDVDRNVGDIDRLLLLPFL